MAASIDHNEFEVVLDRAGSTWSASQAHGLLCGMISIAGADGVARWLATIVDDSEPANALHRERAAEFTEMAAETYRQLSERQSEFAPLLPDQRQSIAATTAGIGEWCDGFLHGLVLQAHDQALKDKLAAEPVSDIIKDMLQITRADVGEDDDPESNEEALTELVEYVRVTTQLIYEELSDTRHELSADGDIDAGVVH